MRIAVLGAGVAGLVAGLRQTQAGHTVDVYERWPGLGGQAATIDVGGGHRLERYYHHLFSTDRHIAALYDELGMPDELEWLSSSVAYFADGKQWPFVTPLDLAQPTVSKHLKVLHEAGLVRVRPDGNRRLFSLEPQSLAELDAWLAPFRRRWADRFDLLEQHLDEHPDRKG